MYAASKAAAPALELLHTLEGIFLANGMAADHTGGLYMTTTMRGMILRLWLDADDPTSI